MTTPAGQFPVHRSEKVPADSSWLFPEYDFATMNLEDHAGIVIERILERGSWEQVHWLFAHYGQERIAAWVRRHGFRLLSKRSFALWRLVLEIADPIVPNWAVEARRMEPW